MGNSYTCIHQSQVIIYLRYGSDRRPRITVCRLLVYGNRGRQTFYKLHITDKPYRVTEDCVGCGQCEIICPLANIRLQEGRPTWGGNCTQCMACISICPKDAIEYGLKTRGKRRYYLRADSSQLKKD